MLGMLCLLAAMVDGYRRDKERFKRQLRRESGGSAAAAQAPAPVAGEASGEGGFDYMQVRSLCTLLHGTRSFCFFSAKVVLCVTPA